MQNNNIIPFQKETSDCKAKESLFEKLHESNLIEINSYKFYLLDKGLVYLEYHKDKEATPVILSDKIEVLGDYETSSGSNGRLVRIYGKDGKIKDVAIPRSLLNSSTKEVMKLLGDYGCKIELKDSYKRLLMEYINGVEKGKKFTAVNQSGWFNESTYLLKEKVYGTNDSVFYKNVTNADTITDFKIIGTLEDWKNKVSRYAINNSRLVFAISSAFSSVFLSPLNLKGVGFSFVGKSSKGKTTALAIASSVFGDTYKTDFSDNGIAKLAPVYNDNILILDDLQCDFDTLKNTVYKLINGQSKIKFNYDNSGLEDFNKWKLVLLCSSEHTQKELAKTEKKNLNLGQEIRLIEINADCEKGLGLFESIHGFEKPNLLADYIQENAEKYRGVAGDEFLKRVTGDLEHSKLFVKEHFEIFIDEITKAYDIKSSLVLRVLKSFALVASCGELASSYGITGWKEGEAIKAVKICFADWFKRFGGDEHETFDKLENFKRFIENNGYRFNKDFDNPIKEQIGFKKKNKKGKTIYYISLTNFNDTFCNGKLDKDFRNSLIDRNIIKIPENPIRLSKNIVRRCVAIDVEAVLNLEVGYEKE